MTVSNVNPYIKPTREPAPPSPISPAKFLPNGHVLCLRCHLGFPTYDLWLIHVEISLDHNLCPCCAYTKDFDSFNQLQNHLEQDHLWCEVCNWYAPSAEGLEKHLAYWHFMCMACKEIFKTLNELTGHANSHRPLTVSCFMCDERFVLRSAAYNHIESEKCAGGALREDVRNLVREFWANLPQNITGYKVPDSRLFTCQPCNKSYSRLCDLLQHVETRTCTEGYCKGNGAMEGIVRYVEENLPNAIASRKQRDVEQFGRVTRLPGSLVHPRVGRLRNEKF